MPRGSGFGSGTAARIVRTIWQNPRISRVDIAERLGLDKSTVSNQVARLIEIGLIEEIDEGLSSTRGGRRPIHLSINSSYGKVIGVEIHVDSYIAVAVDLAGTILGEKRGRISTLRQDYPGTMLDVVGRCIQTLCPGGKKLLGVGIGVGGLVDAEKGEIRYSVPLGIDSCVDVASSAASCLDVPWRIENDANCCAWGELAFNRSESLRNFLFSLVEFRRDSRSMDQSGGIGVGFGIVLGGRVYAGSHGKAGEFRSVLCEGSGRSQLSLSAADLVRFDSDKAVLAAAADELSRNIAMLANTMDFERIYVGGDIENLDVDFPGMLRRRLAENWMYPIPSEIDIRYSSLGNRAVAYGAAGMMLNRLVSEEPILVSNALEGRI